MDVGEARQPGLQQRPATVDERPGRRFGHGYGQAQAGAVFGRDGAGMDGFDPSTLNLPAGFEKYLKDR